MTPYPRFVAVLSVLIVGAMPLQAQDSGDYDISTYKERSQLLVDSIAAHGQAEGFWGGGKYGAYPAMAQFERGHVEMGRNFARKQLTGSGAMFREFGTMALYMEYHDEYSPELRQRVKQNQLEESVLYDPEAEDNLPGASENHKLMYAAANYLGGLEWGEDYPTKWFEAGRAHLNEWFDELTRIGFWENDSPTYLVHHLGPLVSVADHAPEGSAMKRKATMVLDWYFASIAGEYLEGYWITSSARDYAPVHGMHLSEESATSVWLQFGGTDTRVPHPAPTAGHPPYLHWMVAVHLAVGEYQVPTLLQRIATDRDSAFVHREYMRRNPMRPRESNFVGRRYGIAAIVGEGGERIPPDMTRWKVQWVPREREAEPSTFFVKHPKPGEEDWRVWQGASPYEQVLRHDRTLLAVYDIPPDDSHPFIEAPVRREAYDHIVHRGDWWFFHTGSMLMAAYTVEPFRYLDDRRHSYSHYGTTAKTRVLRSDGRHNGLVLQTAPLSEYEGSTSREVLEAFARAVQSKTTVDTSDMNAEQPGLGFSTLAGDELSVRFDGQKSVNGSPLSVENWPLMDNPWMHQDLRGNQLILKHDDRRRIYDFALWRIRTESVTE